MPEVERAITILPRVGRQLPPRTSADFPTEHSGRRVKRYDADAKDCVECFKHLESPSVFSLRLCAFARKDLFVAFVSSQRRKGAKKEFVIIRHHHSHHRHQTYFPTTAGVQN